jgi:hypothetical protein
VASYAELKATIRERDTELAMWRERFRALVGEDSPDAAGNAVIHLQSEAKRLEELCAVLADKFDRAEQRCAALHRTDRPQLRDELAAAALTGMLAGDDYIAPARAAELSYEFADAMLARRAVVKP